MHSHHHNGKSRVKVIHNVAKGPAVNVLVDGNKVLSNVDYKAQSDYLKLPSGKHRVSIAAGGKELASANVNLSPRTDYTVIAHGDVNNLSSIALLALEDNNSCPANGKAHLRFVHAAAGAPPVDIWVGDKTKIFENVSYGSTGNPTYLPVDAGVAAVSVTPTGSYDRVLGPLSLNLENGKVYTVTASGVVEDNQAPLTALVHEDRKCPVHHLVSPVEHHHHHHYNGKSNSNMMGLWMNL